MALTLGGCSSTPGPRAGADGPPLETPVDVSRVPDAEPRVEPIRAGGPNKPYEVLGQSYAPMTADQPLAERGLASWYGRKFHGRRTASGEIYNMNAMTAAHKTMPIPSYARVRNPANGREVIVRINDRGPFSAGRVIDLSWAAAVRLGVERGVAPVEVERLTHDEIRAGVSTRSAPSPVLVAPAPAPAPAPVALASAKPAPSLPMAAAAPPGAASPTGPTSASTILSVAAPVAAPIASPAVAPPMVSAATLPTPSAAPPVLQARAHTGDAAGFWLQLGAFGRGEGAYQFQQKVAQELDWLSPLLTVFAEGGMHRLQAGPYVSRDQAREVAERVRLALQLVPVIVERR